MLNFRDYFVEEYHYTLSKAEFNIINSDITGDITSKITDSIDAEFNKNVLHVKFARSIQFIPEAIFKLKVVYLLMLTVKEEVLEDAKEINWKKEFAEQSGNPYFSNVIPRAAGLIADITSAYGQTPFITPPTLIK